MDVVSRFLLASFQGDFLLRPSKVSVHLLGISKTPALLSLSRNDLGLLTEPAISAWLANEFQNPQFTQINEISINLNHFRDKIVVFLDSEGTPYKHVFSELHSQLSRTIFAIGAQEDIPDHLMQEISRVSHQTMLLSLGNTEYLASQTATILRYLITRNFFGEMRRK